MTLDKNEYSTDMLIKWLTRKHKHKVTGEPFNKSDIAQYLRRGMVPYRYGRYKLSSKKQSGIRIITVEEY